MMQGERVREIRKSLKMTTEAFGNKVGVQRSAISKIEKGSVSLTDQMAKSICREFNVNLDYLMHGDLPMFSDLPKTILDDLCKQYNCDSLDKSIIECYLKLTAFERQTIKKYIQDIHAAEAATAVNPPSANFSELSIDEKVAIYRQELEYEKKVEGKSEVS